MISKEEFAEEFSDLAYQAGIRATCAIEFPEYMADRNRRSPRSYAEVDPHALYFAFAPQVLELPWQYRRGLLMHEIGHVLCRDMDGGGTEGDADKAAEHVFGERIIYDKSWPGKGLQCVCSMSLERNPPYSGYDKGYFNKKSPADPTKISYRTKRDALNVFLDHNSTVVEEVFDGLTRGVPDSYDNINHRFDLKGKRRVDNLAKALWWAMPTGSPYYLEDIDVHMLNDTPAMQANYQGLLLQIPDYVEESRLLAKEMAYYEDKYGTALPDEPGDTPF